MNTFGRDRELAVLDGLVDAAVRGNGGCTVLTGPPGIGKTHLIRAALSRAATESIGVASRTAFELDRAAPLITLASTLQQVRPRSVNFDWIAQYDGTPFQKVNRLVTAVEEYAVQRPLLIVIDDAQWMDELSALAIRELVMMLATAPVQWVFARRPNGRETPGQQLADRLVAERTAADLTLGGLNEDAVRQLCESVVQARVDDTVLALAAGLDGHPLYIEQLMRTLRMTDQLMISEGEATVIGGDRELPSSFVTIVDQMLSGLRPETRALLEAGSVFARPFRIDAVAELCDVRPSVLLPAVGEAVATRVLVESRDELDFSHDLVRRAVYGTLGGAIRSLYHTHAAAIGRRGHRPAVEVAHHLIRSGRSSGEAVTLLRQAAREVSAAAPSTAADLLLESLQLLGEHDPARVNLTADLVGFLALASRLPEAHRYGEAALGAGLDPETEARLLLGLAEAFKHAGRNADAVDYAERALRREGFPDEVRARLWAIHAHAKVYVGPLAEADRSGAMAERIGTAADPGAAAFGLAARSLVALTTGRLAEAVDQARRATELADGQGGDAMHRHPRIWLANALMAVDEFDEASRELERGRRESERYGTAWSTPLWHYYNANLLYARGSLDDAVAEADAGVKIAEELTAVQLTVPLLGILVRLAVAKDETDQARAFLDRMYALMRTGITAPPEDTTWSEAILQNAVAGSAVAAQVLAGMYDDLSARPAILVQDSSAAVTLASIATGAGERSRAETVVAAARRLAEANPSVRALAAAADHAAGLVRGDVNLLRSAVATYRRTPRRLGLAAALEDAARLIGAADRNQGRALRAEALDIAQECRAGAAVRRLGGGSTPPGSSASRRVRSESIREKLTPAELKVAELVADGLTNRKIAERLFLSSHTVDSHLRKIFTKAGVSGRVALTRLMTEDRGTNGGTT